MLINCAWNKLAAEEGVLDTYLHHNLAILLTPKPARRNSIHPLHDVKEKKINCFC